MPTKITSGSSTVFLEGCRWATTALDVELTGEKLAYLEELYVPHPIVANSSLFIVNYTGQTLRVFGSIEEATQRLLLRAITRF